MAQITSAFETFMRGMSLNDFVKLFLFYKDPATGESTKFQPWPKQSEFMDWIDDIDEVGFLLKSRQAGGSTLAAALTLKTAFEYPNIQVLVLSKDEDSAKLFLSKRLMDAYKDLPKIQGLTWPKVTMVTQQHIEFSNGSKISSTPATAIGSAGITAKLVIFDEVALVDLNAAARGGAEQVFATLRPTVMRAKGKIFLLSTARPGSFFNTMVEGILDGSKKDMSMFFFGAKDDPTMTDEAFGKLRSQYHSDIDFRREFPLTPADAFLNRTGLVFKSFNPEVHICAPNIPEYCYTIASHDFGYRHKSTLLIMKYDYVLDVLYVTQEHSWQEVGAEVVGKSLRVIRAGLPIDTKWVADAAIFNRTGQEETISDIFTRMGIPFTPSYKYKGNDPYTGTIAKISMRFAQNKILINPSCVGLIKELRTWSWKENSVREMPQDTGDDFIDALKYGLMHCILGDRPMPREKPLPYSDERNSRRGFFTRFGSQTEVQNWQEC